MDQRRPKEPDSKQPRESKEPDSQQPVKPINEFVGAPENKALGAERPVTLLPTAPSQNRQLLRRLFSEDARAYILSPITKIDNAVNYIKDAVTLLDALSQPLSEEDFETVSRDIQSKRKDSTGLRDILDEILRRFRERWGNAEEVTPTKEVVSQTVSEIFKGKVKSD